MKKLAAVLMLSLFALTVSPAFAGDDKKCDAKMDKKSCADKSKKCCAGEKDTAKKGAKPADTTEAAKPAAAVKDGAASH